MSLDQSADTTVRTSEGVSAAFVAWLRPVRSQRLLVAFFGYVACAIVLFPETYAHFWTGKVHHLATAFSFAILVVVFVSVIRTPASPWSSFRAYVRRRGLVVFATFGALVFGLSAFSTIKVNIPNVVPFYADGYIAGFERTILGVDAWRLAHAIVPDRVAGVVDFIYSKFWFVGLICCYAFAAVIEEGARFKRFMWTALAIYAGLGSILALVFSCVGPIFYDDFYAGNRFAGLTDALQANPGIVYISQYADFLLWSYRENQPQLGSGISAMPSLHVAVAVLTAWFLTSHHRWLAVIGWVYATVIGVSSVYTGWHYLLDGVVSFLVVSAIWVGLSRYYGLPALPNRPPDS